MLVVLQLRQGTVCSSIQFLLDSLGTPHGVYTIALTLVFLSQALICDIHFLILYTV